MNEYKQSERERGKRGRNMRERERNSYIKKGIL